MAQFIFPPVTTTIDSESSDGGALPSSIMIIGGYDGSAVQVLKTDSDGELQIDISTSALPSGAATATLQTTGNSILTTIDADTSLLAGAIAGTELQVDVVASLPAGTNAIGKLSANSGVDIGDVDVLSSALPSGAATSALQTTANGILTTIDADTGSIAGAISGSEMQVDVVASLPAGSNAIGKLAANSGVDIGDVTLNAGTAAFGKLSANSGVDIGSVGLLAGSNAIGKLAANSGVDIGDVDILSLPADSKNYVWKEGLDSTIGGITNSILDTSTTNIPSGTQLTVATLANDVYEIQTVEDIGEFMGIYAGSTLKAILPLGGGSVKINLPSTTVVKLASFSGTAISSGNMAINFLG